MFTAVSRLIAANNDCSPIAATYMASRMATKEHKEKWDNMLELILPLLIQPSSPKLLSAVTNSCLARYPILDGYAELVNKHAQKPTYNAAYTSLVTKNLVKKDAITLLLNQLKHGNDRAILFALLTTHNWLEHTKKGMQNNDYSSINTKLVHNNNNT
jgi:hypothetical protein